MDWETAGVALLGAVVGGALSAGSTVWVNRRELVRSHRLELYRHALPRLSLALRHHVLPRLESGAPLPQPALEEVAEVGYVVGRIATLIGGDEQRHGRLIADATTSLLLSLNHGSLHLTGIEAALLGRPSGPEVIGPPEEALAIAISEAMDLAKRLERKIR